MWLSMWISLPSTTILTSSIFVLSLQSFIKSIKHITSYISNKFATPITSYTSNKALSFFIVRLHSQSIMVSLLFINCRKVWIYTSITSNYPPYLVILMSCTYEHIALGFFIILLQSFHKSWLLKFANWVGVLPINITI